MHRNLISLPISRGLALAVPGIILICAPAAATPAPKQTGESQATMAWRGDMEGRPVAGSEVVEDASHWNELWRRLNRDTPPFDLTNTIAVVAYAGQQPTPGYSIEFLKPVAQGDDLLLTWHVLAPSPGSFRPQVITQPWEVQTFQRPKGIVVVEQAIING